MTFNPAGISYLETVAAQIMQNAFTVVTIPDITGTADSPIGKITYTFSNIVVQTLQFPSTSIALSGNSFVVSS